MSESNPSNSAPQDEGLEKYSLPPVSPDEQEQAGIDNIIPTRGYSMLPVVGLGGSAGSIRALEAFLEMVPWDSGLAFVVAIHLSPHHESTLPELLQRSTRMPVLRAEDATQVAPNTVYVIPPGKHLTLAGDHLRLTDMDTERGRRIAVDLLFRSLADTHGPHATAVIFSGADGDGALGIKRIKERGGLTIAQEPTEAEHAGMPTAAIDTHMVDWVLPVREMPRRIVEYHARERKLKLPPEEGPQPAQITPVSSDDAETALREVLILLRARTGRDFTYYKRATIVRRISRRMQINGIEDLPGYLSFLRTHSGESGALLQELLISVTNFFRDRECFEALERHIPELFLGKQTGDTVRIWVPACASGEEAYSIAILLLEHARKLDTPPNLQIFACDLDDDSIKVARSGIYPQTIAADVSEERLRSFFIKEHNHYRVKQEVRELVLFASHDLLKDAPFSRIDLISCRNLFIYLDREAQSRALNTFHFALRLKGFLFLGSAETIDDESALFEPLDKKHRIYRRCPAEKTSLPVPIDPSAALRAAEMPVRLKDIPGVHGGSLALVSPPQPIAVEVSPEPHLSASEIHFKLLGRFGPASIVVNAGYDIVHLSDRANRYLLLPGGEPTRNLMRLIHPALRNELRAALFRAAESDAPVEALEIPITVEGKDRLVSIRAGSAQDIAPGFLLIVFEEREVISAPQTIRGLSIGTELQPLLDHLERELEQTKLQLRETIERHEASTEELKAGNEELTAMNEELRSAGEELETSREELQSVNEELTTVNDELKRKVDELAHTSSDMQSLMASTAIATVFLDRELCIMRYTPSAVELFRMIPTDVGRPLSDLKHQLECLQLDADAMQVLRTLVPIEHEVRSGDGRWFLARLQPYRTLDDHIAGVVLTFVDITERRRAEEQLAAEKEYAESIVQTLHEPLLVLDPDLTVRSVNAAFYTHFQVNPAETIGRKVYDLGNGQWNIPALRTLLEDVLPDSNVFNDHEVTHDFEMLGHRVMLVNGRRLDHVQLILLGIRDITERKRAEVALRVSEERFRALFAASPAPLLILQPDAPRFTITTVNDAYLAATMRTREELIGRGMFEAFPDNPDDTAADGMRNLRASFARALAARRPDTMPVQKYDIARPDGTFEERWWSPINSPVLGKNGEVEAIIHHVTDVTEEHRAEEALRASEEQYRDALDTMSEGFALFGPDFTILDINAETLRLDGRTREEIVGRNHWEAFPGSEDSPQGEMFKRVMRDRVPAGMEHSYQWPDGKTLWVDTRAYPTSHGRVGILWRDITERKQRERQQEFLLELSDVLRAETNADEMANRALRMLSEQMNLDRCYIGAYRPEEDRADLTHQVGNNRVPPLPDAIRLSDFPEALRVASDRTLVIDNFAETEGLSDVDRRNIGALGLRALLAASLRKGANNPLWTIVAVAASPRRWTQGEIALLEEVTERTWAAMERARAEAALRESEARLTAVFEALPVGVGFTDIHGGLMLSNREMQRYLPSGGMPSRDDTQHARWRAFHADGRPVERHDFPGARAQRGEKVVPGIEMLHTRHDGTEVWTQVAAVPLNDGEGRITGHVAVITNVDALKRAETTLRESEARLSALATASSEVLYRMSPDWGEIREFSGGGFIAKTANSSRDWLMDYIPPEDHSLVTSAVNEAIRTKSSFTLEHRVHRADGTIGWTLSKAVPILDRDGEIVEWFGAAADVTHRKEADAERERLLADERDARERVTSVLESISDAFYAVDAEFRFTYVNRKAEELWGRSRESLLGRHYWTEFPHAVGSEPHQQHLVAMAERRPVHFETLSPLIGRWIDVNLYPEANGGLACYFRDITERHEAEQALRENEEQFRRAIEDAPIPVIMHAEDGQVLQISKTWTELTGYTAEEIPTFEAWLNRAYGPGAEQVRAHMHQLFQGVSRQMETELDVTTRTGKTRRWSFSASAPGTLRDGRRFIVGMALDITERRAAEEALREGQRQLSAIFSGAAVGLSEISLDGRFLRVNDELCRILGRSREEMLTLGVIEVTHPDDVAPSRKVVRQVVETGKPASLDKRYLQPDGTVIWAVSTAARLDDENGHPRSLLVAVADLTARKQAEEALQESQERLRLILENAHEYAIFSLDLKRRVTSWNSGAQNLLGYSIEEAIGQSGDIIFTEEDRADGAPEEEAGKALSEGRAADERWHVRKDGSRFWASGVAMPMRDAKEQVIGFVKILRDQTREREAKMALEQSREELRTALQETENAKAEVEAAGKAKDHFLAVLSHELRTPLNPVIIATRVLSRRKDLPPDIVEMVEMIRRNIRLEAQFIDELLDLTRIARGKMELNRESLDLHSVVQHAVQVADPDIQTKSQQMVIFLDAREHQVFGDATRLQQVFWNLLRNASKFTPEGGEIRLRTRNEPGQIIVEVQDSGIGFDPEAGERIFNAFEQASEAVTREFGGLGLGLAISKASVDAHGGAIRAESLGPNQGATFVVALPLLPRE